MDVDEENEVKEEFDNINANGVFNDDMATEYTHTTPPVMASLAAVGNTMLESADTHGIVWYTGMVWYGMVWVWNGMMWYGIVWYSMVWYNIV